MGLLSFRTAVKPPTISAVVATSTSQLDPVWTLPVGFSVSLTELEFSLDGSSGWTQIYSGTALTFAHTGRAANTTYYYRARVKDAQNNYSSYSGVTSQTTPSGSYIKHHPGHGMIVQEFMAPGNAGYTASDITDLSGETNIKTVLIRVYWAALESAKGIYTFSDLDAFILLCQSVGKRVIIQVQDRTFTGTSASGFLPSYLATESGGGGGWHIKTPSNTGVVAKYWLAPIMDRYIALLNAMGARYDLNAYVEGITNCESSAPDSPAPSDWTSALATTQIQRWMLNAPLAFPHTHVFCSLNFLSGKIAGLVAYAAAHRCNISGPDTVPVPAPPDPLFGTAAQRVYLGYNEDGSPGGIDYTSKILAMWQVQGPELGGHEGTFTMSSIGNAGATYGGSYMEWLRLDRVARPNWLQDELIYLQGSPAALTTAVPSCYDGYAVVTG